jgi:LemA protein
MISQTLSKLLLLQESYPDLKADQWFLNLQTQLEWTENRISVERDRYNDKVKVFNVYIKQFPNNIFAWFFHFKEKAFFEAIDWAKNATEVNFNS